MAATKSKSSKPPSTKGKGKASEHEELTSKPKLNRSKLGAPSQLNQSSRKGKKAWRKHVDIGDVEAGLEEERMEERVLGSALSKKKDQDLFVVDLEGDKRLRDALPKKLSLKNLTSTRVLEMRSAVPAVFSRTTSRSTSNVGNNSGSQKRKLILTREEKDRLLRIAKRPRKGPFNSILDPAEYEPGSGTVELSRAVKESGGYDPWASEVPKEVEEIKDGLEHVQKKVVKPPILKNPHTPIQVPAVAEPHQGASYNPPVDAHQELLLQAAAIEEKRVRDAERLAEVKAKMDMAVVIGEEDHTMAVGMKVQVDDGEYVEEEDGEEVTRTMPRPKTKSQRNKAARVLAEKRALAERAERKRLVAFINDAKSFRKSIARTLTAKEKEREAKRFALLEKLRKKGLAGTKLGKHKVPEGRVEVQLGEDLTESLRGLKPEGNLFRDRFQSLQQRALIEPRVPVIPKKRRHRVVEYEKHAWKRFE